MADARRGGFFREAHWLNGRRLGAYPIIFLAIYAIAIIIYLSISKGLVDPWNRPVGTDFMDVWAAGKLALAGTPEAAYDYPRHFAVQKAALRWRPGEEVPFFGWHYPPVFLLAASLLALLPYGWALAVWVFSTLPVYLAAIHAVLPGRKALLAALAYPATFVNLGHGQNGFLTAGLFGGALVLLEKKPFIAGILIGLLAYKPQFGLLIPLALLAGGHWRAIFSAGVTVCATAALSYLLFGAETWQAFAQSLGLTRSFVLEQGPTGWHKIQSIFAAVRLWGGSIALAYVFQGIFTLAAVAATVWTWRKPVDMALKGAVLLSCSLLATPYVLDYDLMVLAFPILWLAVLGLHNGFHPWEKSILIAAWLLPLLSRSLAMAFFLPLGPVVMAALLAIALLRVKAVSIPSPIEEPSPP